MDASKKTNLKSPSIRYYNNDIMITKEVYLLHMFYVKEDDV